jgi:dihydrofolate reductase
MISAIFSVDQTGGVGNKGTLPWKHHPEDMEWFKEYTADGIVVMGRKTWDDPKMPKPLPGRINVIATSRALPRDRLIHKISGNLNEEIPKLQDLWPGKKIWLLGGVELLLQCKDITDYAYVTHRKGSHYADVRLDMNRYFSGMQVKSSRPSEDKMLNLTVYKNIDPFR